MLTLLMKGNKELIISVPAKIYQRESNVDALQVLIPLTYDDMSLKDFTASIEYVDPANIARSEMLVRDEEIYKDGYYRHQLPVGTSFTNMAGDVRAKLSLTHLDSSTGVEYVLHTNEVTITITTWEDYFAYTPSSQIGVIDAKMLELDNKINELKALEIDLDKAIPDDLSLTDDLLQLSVKGEPEGEGVRILINPDEHDGQDDGEEDIDADDPSGAISELDLDSLIP